MQVIEPDFDRVTDLPGGSATPCPVDVDQALTGFRALATFRIHELTDGIRVDGGSEEEETILVLLAGAVAVSGAQGSEFQLDADGDWAVYLPPGHRYRLEPLVPTTLAEVRARATGAAAPRAFHPARGILAIDEPAQRLRLRLLPLEGETDASAGLGSGLERLVHFTGPARVAGRELPPMHTLALSPGENVHATGEGEMLAVAALSDPASAAP